MLNGKDLIIECDGKPLAAAKSCSIEVNAETIQVSDIVHGGWEHYRAGRKSWKISTGHLVARYGILQLGYDDTNSQVPFMYIPRYTLPGFSYPFRLIAYAFNPVDDERILTLHGNNKFIEESS